MTAAWSCPLCAYSHHGTDTHAAAHRHAVTEHPATLPAHMTTRDRLDTLARLIAEVEATVGAPNPSGESGRRTSNAAPPAPADLAALDVLRVGDECGPSLLACLVQCSRIVWEAWPPDVRARHPQPEGVQWATEVRWLGYAWSDAQAWLDLADHDWIEAEVRHVTSAVAAVARITRPIRYRCPQCGDQLKPEGDVMRCDTGHEHPGPQRLATEYRRKPPMTTDRLADLLGIQPERIRKWHERRRIKPTNPGRKPLTWLPWDAVSLLYPDIAADIDTRTEVVTSV